MNDSQRQRQKKEPAVLANWLPADPLAPPAVGKLVRKALRALRQGEAYGVKMVLEPSRAELPSLIGKTPLSDAYMRGERANWKLAALLSVNSAYGAVKIIGSHSYNRRYGIPRSTATILLYDKLTMRPLAILDGTALSAQRTGAYASIVVECLIRHCVTFSVFLFGAGRVASAIVEDLMAHHPDRIDTLYVRSRTCAGAENFVAHFMTRKSFRVVAAKNLEALPNCTLVITASNADRPLFEAWQIDDHAVVLHLGGDETPDELVRYILEVGTVVCDDISTVAHRCSQSLPLFFYRTGRALESVAEDYQIRDLWQLFDEDTSYRLPALVTCVGLPVLDLYLAQHAYEMNNPEFIRE